MIRRLLMSLLIALLGANPILATEDHDHSGNHPGQHSHDPSHSHNAPETKVFYPEKGEEGLEAKDSAGDLAKDPDHSNRSDHGGYDR